MIMYGNGRSLFFLLIKHAAICMATHATQVCIYM